MLYEYFKEQFLQKTAEFGHEKLAHEKKVLRNLSERTLRKCKKQNADEVCKYFEKGEIDFLEEVRENQTNKSVQIIVDKILNEVKELKLNEPKIQKTVKILHEQIKEFFTTIQRKNFEHTNVA